MFKKRISAIVLAAGIILTSVPAMPVYGSVTDNDLIRDTDSGIEAQTDAEGEIVSYDNDEPITAEEADADTADIPASEENPSDESFILIDGADPGDPTDEQKSEEGNEPIYKKNGLSVYGIDYYGGNEFAFRGGIPIVIANMRVYKNGVRLYCPKDFSESYKNNKNAGTAYLILKPAGNYTGKPVEVPFTINPYDLTPTVYEYTWYDGDGGEHTETNMYYNFNYNSSDLNVMANGNPQKLIPKLTTTFRVYQNNTQTTITLKGSQDAGKGDFTISYPDTEEGAYVKPGYWTIRITGNGNFKGTADIKEQIYTAESSKAISKAKVKPSKTTYTFDELIGTGEEGQMYFKNPEVKITDGNKDLAPSQYYAYWSECKCGKVKIMIQGSGEATETNPTKYYGNTSVTVNITGTKLTPSNVEVVGLKPEYIFEGYYLDPLPPETVLKVNGKEITDRNAWSYVLTNNKKTGTAKLTIKGNEYFGLTGTVTKTFKIVPHKLSEFTYYVKDSSGEYIAYSEAEKNKINVRYQKSGATTVFDSVVLEREGKDPLRLYRNTDYTIKMSGNKTVGNTGYVEVKGINNYKGLTYKVPFTVIAGDISTQCMNVPDVVINNKQGGWMSKPVITDSTGAKLKEGTDYEKLTAADYSYEGKETGTAPAVGTVINVTINGKGNYAGSTVSGSYRIIEKSADIGKATFKIKDKVFIDRNTPIEFTAEDFTTALAADKKTNLVFGKDFGVSGYYFKNVGTYKVTLKGMGDFGGEKTVTFKVVGRPIVE